MYVITISDWLLIGQVFPRLSLVKIKQMSELHSFYFENSGFNPEKYEQVI